MWISGKSSLISYFSFLVYFSWSMKMHQRIENVYNRHQNKKVDRRKWSPQFPLVHYQVLFLILLSQSFVPDSLLQFLSFF